ncbi:MAG: hypothetical protein JXC36_08495 [Candidatus Atribacteria bacterium]|nr:hypothetical protein [Candidatus Atribacteria bacterium]
MNIEIISHKPKTRCYICHKEDIDKICHHCGNAICKTHNSTFIPFEKGVENPEYSNLDLDHLHNEKEIIHCKDCMHYVKSYKWMRSRAVKLGVFGLILGIIGVIGELWLMVLASVILIGTSIIWYLSINKKHKENYEIKRIKKPPLFPVIPNIKTISVTENLAGSIILGNDGKFATQADKIMGKISITLQFSQRDRERLDAYLNEYKLSKNESIEFNSGFAMLECSSDLKFDDPNIFLENRPNIISLKGTIGEQPFLFKNDSLRDNYWTNSFSYIVVDNNEDKNIKLPIQIIPTLVQEGAQRAIDIVVQIPPIAYDILDLGKIRIEEFILYAPRRLSKISLIQPSAVTSAVAPQSEDEEPLQKIVWKGIDIRSEGIREQRYRFYLRFENKIEPTTIFHGSLKLSFTGTLSDFKEMKFFYPWGKERIDNFNFQRLTYLDVKYELNLGGLRFQEQALETTQLERKGVIPDHAMVTQLTEDLNNSGFYLKRVIENPARTSKAGAHITNRFWDIAGRYYEGVYPIDFHLVLTGEEAYGKRNESRVQVDVSVQGIVSNKEMKKKVVQLRDQLSAITENTIDTLPEISTEISLQNELNQLDFQDHVNKFPESIDEKETEKLSSSEVRSLLDMLKKLDEALIEGHINEVKYEEIQKRYKKQLKKLGYSV